MPDSWGSPATVRLLAVTSLVAGVLVAASPAQATPERVLQSVDVDLAPDGTVAAITSTSVHEIGDESREEGTGFDPAETADELPVRIQTAWRLGDRAGTDLADVAGEAGRVVVEVTVQNTTVEPQELAYDVDGVRRTAHALVGTPLTVVAGAELGEGQVVARDDQQPSAVTNGVVQEPAGDEAGSVQWAAILAPPRLGASTTFRLVQETESFEVPDFDISVQPGLVTDASVRRLLESAFSDEATSTVSMESRTIELVTEVNTLLADAGGVLGELEAELRGTADRLGVQAINDLQASSERITTSMRAVASDLDEMSALVASRMDGAQSDAVTALAANIQEVKDLLGDPTADYDVTIQPGTGRCAELDVPPTDGSVYRQLVVVSEYLDALGDATEACQGAIEADLRATVGALGQECTDDSETAICALRAANAELAEQAVQLTGLGTHLGETLGGLDDAIDVLVRKVRGVQDQARELQGLADLDDGLTDIQAALTDLSALLDPDSTEGIAAQLGSVNDEAVAALGVLGGATTAIQQADEIRTLACSLPVDPTDTTALANRDRVAELATGEPCAGAPSGTVTSPLKTRLATVEDHLATIEELSDMSAPGSSLVRELQDLQDQVDAQLATVTDLLDDEQAIQTKVGALVTSVNALFTGDLASRCPDPTAAPDPELAPVDAVQYAYKVLACFATDKDLEEALADLGEGISLAQDTLTDSETTLDTARVEAEQGIADLVGDLSDGLTDASADVAQSGRQTVTETRERLDVEVTDFASALDRSVADALLAIEDNIRESTTDLAASERLLVEDLRRVLADLGDRRTGGGGILGALVTGAANTGLANDTVGDATEEATSFSRVRGQELEDVRLQQAQLARSLELQQQFPAFGLDLPDGSTSLTVFTFHVGQD